MTSNRLLSSLAHSSLSFCSLPSPVMRYGWPAPRQTLLTYAKEHGLILMMRRRNRTLPDESDGESSDDDANESSTDDGTKSIKTDDNSSSKGGDESDGSRTAIVEETSRTFKRLPPLFTRTDVDEPASMVAALGHIFTRLTTKDGLRLPAAMNIFLTLQHGGGERQLISVYTNYHLLRKDLPRLRISRRSEMPWGSRRRRSGISTMISTNGSRSGTHTDGNTTLHDTSPIFSRVLLNPYAYRLRT
ncbi:uncharacterized protein B0H18DRAFT_285448 [Fomitopsis serialis]|uniref:uncharacterized protein n=1 Tax=Fomitopsis serialis TaxID=139415 RepID=UPI0020083B53|nr:uncharacterized protein B0H18DRAFT_285448 [Neoantrodia serialis]KAH9927701.1 hypothetical protein B0H18DRAFT_285448 [Neoantrodia serialis]